VTAARRDDAPPGAFGFEVRRASVVYGPRRVLDQVDLAFAPGEVVALVGPSGAGKTTLLRLLNAALAPTEGVVLATGPSGAVQLDRATPRELRALRSRIGFVHQDLALVPNVRVLQNVLHGRLGRQGFVAALRSSLFPSRAEEEAAARLLDRVGIGEKLFQRTDTLSGGQRQRVAIARALYQEPAALLCDEPVSSVDPARARDTVLLLTALAKERGFTLVVSLHDVRLAREFFPRLVALRGGSVWFDRRTAEVRPSELEELYRLERVELLADGS